MHDAKGTRWYQFTLRGTLILVSVCAILFGVVRYQAVRAEREWKHEEEAIATLRSFYGPTSFQVDRKRHAMPAFQRLVPVNNAYIFNRVVRMHLLDCALTDDACRHLGHFRRLRKAELLGCEGADRALHSLRSPRELEHLDVVDSDLTDEGMKSIRDLRELKFLDITGTQVTERGLAQLERLSRLETLHVSGLDLTDKSVRFLYPLSRLTCLVALDTTMSDAAFEQLRCLPALRVLEVGSPQFEKVQVSRIPHLEHLIISGTNVKSVVLSHLPRLAYFGIGQCPCVEQVALTDLPSLTTFASRGTGQIVSWPGSLTAVQLVNLPKLEFIEFSNAPIRLRDVEFRRLDNVKAVLLAFTPTTDPDLLRLEPLLNLRQLVLRGTRVTDEGVRHHSR